MKGKRIKQSASFKAKVALEAIRGQDTVPTIARRHNVHVNMVYKWKGQLLNNLSQLFETENRTGTEENEREAELLKKIGELTVERDFLSKGLERYR